MSGYSPPPAGSSASSNGSFQRACRGREHLETWPKSSSLGRSADCRFQIGDCRSEPPSNRKSPIVNLQSPISNLGETAEDDHGRFRSGAAGLADAVAMPFYK